MKYPDFRILLVALHPGAHLAEHRAPGAISVQTISGHVLFRAAGRAFDLPEGQMLTLEREIPHDIEALAESAVLVTIVLAKKQKVKLLYFAAGLRQLRRLEEFDYDHFSRGGT